MEGKLFWGSKEMCEVRKREVYGKVCNRSNVGKLSVKVKKIVK